MPSLEWIWCPFRWWIARCHGSAQLCSRVQVRRKANVLMSKACANAKIVFRDSDCSFNSAGTWFSCSQAGVSFFIAWKWRLMVWCRVLARLDIWQKHSRSIGHADLGLISYRFWLLDMGFIRSGFCFSRYLVSHLQGQGEEMWFYKRTPECYSKAIYLGIFVYWVFYVQIICVFVRYYLTE